MPVTPDLALIRAPFAPPAARRTKIVCTLGPACWSVEGLTALIDAGMNIARFNFSHGDHTTHAACLERLRAAVASRPGANVAVMLDTKGPEIRTGVLDASCNGKLKLVRGETIEVGTDYAQPCTPQYLACSYKSLPSSVSVGSKMLVADGSLMLEVLEIRATSVMARILNNASIGDKKNMNLPGAIVDLPTLTDKDVDDLTNFGLVHGVDFIAASFVRKASDLDYIREVLGAKGAHIKIISKIENQEGLENFDAILEKTDGIMVARGDLGMEIPIEKVFLAQKMMIHKANVAGRPVVTATQMLESMITNPRPTRAECADVANAVLDGTDAVMLSGETANGDYANDAVGYMAHTCQEAEGMTNHDEVYTDLRRRTNAASPLGLSPAESAASSAVKSSVDVLAKLIVVLSATGDSARLVAKYRPSAPIMVVTASAAAARQTEGYVRGCSCIVVPSMAGSEGLVGQAVASAVRLGMCAAGDRVVVVQGAADLASDADATVMRVIVV